MRVINGCWVVFVLGALIGACRDDALPGDVTRVDAGSVDAGSPDDAIAPDVGPPDAAGDGAAMDAAETADARSGTDTDEPFPIDRGGDGPSAPVTYKGLPLALTDSGEPTLSAVDGVIGVVCVGMSNSNQECADFIMRLGGAMGAEVNGEVRFINCAVGGHAIERWIDSAFDDRLWNTCLGMRLPTGGVRVDQVRVIYHKAANQFGTGAAYFPDAGSDYFTFYENLTAFADRVDDFFPAVQAVYTTSRSYGGFTDRPERGEPLSYEEGHALNTWLADHPVVGGAWQGWGPYIWAPACSSGEFNGSGVCYERDDYQMDGVHPAAGARAKISQMMHDRFSQHAWYRP